MLECAVEGIENDRPEGAVEVVVALSKALGKIIDFTAN